MDIEDPPTDYAASEEADESDRRENSGPDGDALHDFDWVRKTIGSFCSLSGHLLSFVAISPPFLL